MFSRGGNGFVLWVGVIIDPVGERMREQEQQSVTHEFHRVEYPSSKQEYEKN